jgi:endonuclease G
MRRFVWTAIFLGVFCQLLIFQARAYIDISLQMQLGNPSGATADINNYEHYLIQRTVEAIDYNANHGEPNWTSWDLTTNDLGSAARSGSFLVDTNLPANFYRVKDADYTYSGFNRGHMCPSADRTDNTNDNRLVFFISDIIPQTPDNNQGPWARLETYCRALAQTNELLIICGPNGFSGARINTNGPVLIPDYTWKIIVVVPPGGGTALSRITTASRVIAVNMPNIQGIRSDAWTNYLTSVNTIQANTGYSFFTALPPEVASVLRGKVDGALAQPLTPPGIQTLYFTSGQISLVVTGAIAGNYTITATTNLINPLWITLLSTNSPAMPFTFMDTNTALHQRFYRVQAGQ